MLLGLQNVTFEFGARTIVEDATWHIQPNERIGLIGYNGTGKSTLLKVLNRPIFTGKRHGGKRPGNHHWLSCTRICWVLIRKIPSWKWPWVLLKG